MKLPLLVLLVVLFGCSSPLMETIEEEVEIVVTPPSISTLYPESGATGVAIDIDNIVITFNKSIAESSVSSTTIVVTNEEGSVVNGSFTVSGETVNFNPSNNLSYKTVYSVYISDNLLDVNDNSIEADFSWSFTTADAPSSIKPQIKSLDIDSGRGFTNSADVSINIFATDYNGDTDNLNFRYRKSGDTDWSSWTALTNGSGSAPITLDITPGVTESFSYETEVIDASSVKSQVTSCDITYEIQPPTPLDFNWDDLSYFPYNGTLLQITFDEALAPESITDTDFILEKVSDSSLVPGTIGLKSVGDEPDRILELWDLELEPNTAYRVILQPTVSDLAGNQLGGDENVWIFNTGDSIDTDPPDGPVSLVDEVYGKVVPLPTGTIAKGTDEEIRLDFSQITDDFSTIVKMKIWGSSSNAGITNGQTEEEPADADAETFALTKDWLMEAGDGEKYLKVKFRDSALNWSDEKIVKIILDTKGPDDLSSPIVLIENGLSYTNREDRIINLNLSSVDPSGIYKMKLSTTNGELDALALPVRGDYPDDTAYQNALDEFDDWNNNFSLQLPDTDGPYTIYVKTWDYLEQGSSVGSSSTITLDRESPTITYPGLPFLLNTSLQMQNGTDYSITDNTAITDYQWSMISGPGSVYFNAEVDGEDSDDGADIASPYIWADTDGDYFIQLTVTDSAENIGTHDPIPLLWDTTPPADIADLAVQGNNPEFTNSAQPEWTWSASTGADFYRVSFDGFSTYTDVQQTFYSPNTALAEGSHTLSVIAYDYSGNSSAPASRDIKVDTIAPAINISTFQYIANFDNQEITIDFNGGDGSISESGSGLASTVWSKGSGPGTLSFTNPTEKVTNVSANIDGDYVINLSAFDVAGNFSTVQLPLLRDIVAPAAPDLTGPTLTPSVRPNWFWSTGGGGMGVYQWNLDTDADPDWSAETDDTTFSPSDDLLGTPPGIDHTLSVRERDIAGNWSAPSDWTVEVDTSAKTPPEIAINDAYPTIRNVTEITWNAVSGLGGAGKQYRYRIDGEAWHTVASPLSTSPITPTVLEKFDGLMDGNHTLEIQEYIDDPTEWQEDKTGTHTITVDITPPSKPNLWGTGNVTVDDDRTATNDTTPTWTWSSGGGGGIGKYKYRFNSTNPDNDVNTTGLNHTESLTDGTYYLYVSERDQAGNWSDEAYHEITVDTIRPRITDVLITGPTHPDDSDYTYTNSTYVDVQITGDINGYGGTNVGPVKIRYYDYNPSGWKISGTFFTGSSTTINTTLASTNGTKTIYAELYDEAGNYSGYINDSIILDTIAPSGTFYINNNDTATPSLSFKMTLNYTDNLTGTADLEVRTASVYNGSWNSYRTYASTMSSDFQFSPSNGNKYAYITVRDQAGNLAGANYEISDYIYFQLINMTYATKGSSSTTVSAYWTPVSGASGTTYYHLYSSTENGNPNTDPITMTSEGLSTSGSVITESLAADEKEKLRYYYVKPYNATTGGWGPYSPAGVLGFGSNITIIYSPSDATIASNLKSQLQYDLPTAIPSYYSGTQPVWTVTLLPEALVSSTYSSYNTIYGDPVIITPNSSLYATANKVRNIVSSNKGVVAMGYYGGLKFLETASDNWTSWGYPATTTTEAYQQPNEICYGNSYTYLADKYYMYTWRSGNTVWTSPISSTRIPTTTNEDQVAIGTSSSPLNERGLYRPGRDNPVNGWLYGRSQNYSDRFPVVRQGRFLYYGYDGYWTNTTGWAYWINLIARMDNY